MLGEFLGFRPAWPSWGQILVSIVIAGLGLLSANALSQVDEDLRIMYSEYTVAAADIAKVSADVIRYRVMVRQALEAKSKAEFDAITTMLPDQRARIQNAIDRYASASLRVSRSGRSEPQDIKAVTESLDAYFAAASKTINMLLQAWMAKSQKDGDQLRDQAELHAADNAGPKLIQVSIALDRLLETVADVAKDMRDEGERTISRTSTGLIIGSIIIAVLNLVLRRGTEDEEFAGKQVPPRSSADKRPSLSHTV